MGEITQIGCHIECEAVHGHVTRRPHTDRADLTRRLRSFDPDARGAGDASGPDAVTGYRPDDCALERVDVVAQRKSDALQVEDRVAHDLVPAVKVMSPPRSMW